MNILGSSKEVGKLKLAIFIFMCTVMISSVYAQHGDGSAYTVGPAWHWLQDIYSANGVRADDNNDGAIDRANHLLTAGGYSRLFSPVAGSAVLRIEGGAGQYSAIDFYSGGAASWGMGRNTAGNFYIDRAGGAMPSVFISSANQFVGINTNAPVEQLTVAGRISAQPPNSGDDVVTRDYADTNYVNEGQANSVTSVMIVDNTVTSADIQDGAVALSDVDLGALDARYVNEGQANSITSGMINDGQVTSSDIADGGVATVDLANLAVTNAKINDVAWTKITGRPQVSCPAGQKLVTIAADGSTACAIEDDPQVGTVNNGQWCAGSAGQVVCNQAAPTLSISLTDEYISEEYPGDGDCINSVSMGPHVFCFLTYTRARDQEDTGEVWSGEQGCFISGNSANWILNAYCSDHRDVCHDRGVVSSSSAKCRARCIN